MSVSIVIATRDRANFLARALDSLEAQVDAPAFDVIVADNGSSDATPDVVAERAQRGSLAVRRVFVPQPNRGAARNAGVAEATGDVIVFVDDDVWLPEGFVAAHARAHDGVFPTAVSGPIINVPSYAVQPKPGPLNYSRAFFCTCNVSVPRAAFLAAGGFDASFDLYGWEDTELGLRLRKRDVRRAFAWAAYLYHIKPAHVETLDVVLGKTVERARMAARFLAKDDGPRTRLATGAYALNLWRAGIFAPAWVKPAARRIAENRSVPAPVRALAKAQLLDAAYVAALREALEDVAH